MNWIKVDEEIFDHAGKWISRKDAKEQSRKAFLGVLIIFAPLRDKNKMN